MADESDVETALVATVAGAIYPNRTDAAPVGGYACRVMRGKPNAEALNADLAAGVVNVAVTLLDGMVRNTTRYMTDWHDAAAMPPPLSVSMSGNVATLSGPGGWGAVCGVRAAGVGFGYATVAGDTPSSVAAALALGVPGAAANGPVLTLPAVGGAPQVVVCGYSGMASEVRRQEQGFRVSVLAATPDARTAVATVVDQTLAGIAFLTLADGSAGRLRYRETRIDDVPSRADLWRRDLTYTVEYGTRALETVPPMVIGTLGMNGVAAGIVTAGG